MKISRIKRASLFVFILLFVGIHYATATEEVMAITDKQERSYSFNANDSTKLTIQNQYGDITVTAGWNIKKVEIRVVVEAGAQDQKRVKEMLENVSIDMTEKGTNIVGRTNIKSLGQAGKKERIKINYYISMPYKITSSLSQSYGNINLPKSLVGDVKLHVDYGNITGGMILGKLTVFQRYGNLNLDRVSEAAFSLKYCNQAEVKNAETVWCINDYTNMKFGAVDELDTKCSYGNLTVDKVNKARLRQEYGSVTIGVITHSLWSMRLEYANLKVKELSKDFTKVTLGADHSNIEIGIPKATSFNVLTINMEHGECKIDGFKHKAPSKEKVESKFDQIEVNGGKENQRIQLEGLYYTNLTLQGI